MKKLLMLILLCFAIISFSVPAYAEWTPEAFDFTVKKGVGMAMNGNEQGTTGSIVLGSFYSINNFRTTEPGKIEKFKMVEIGVVDIGIGSNEADGGRVALHGGLGGCLFEVLCVSEVYAMRPTLIDSKDRPWRTNFFVDIIRLGQFANLDAVPGVGGIFKK